MDNEWQPIEDAPVDVPVLIGQWRQVSVTAGMRLEWVSQIAVAWETEIGFWGRKLKTKTWDGKRGTHFKLLPEPPKGNDNAQP